MALRRRRNGLALLRRNGQKDKMVMQAGGLSRAATKALKKSNYKRYQSLFRKAGGEKALKARVASGEPRRRAMVAKFKGKGTGRTTRKRTTRKRTTAAKTGARRSRKMSRWTKFQKSKKGLGWSNARIADEYRKSGGGHDLGNPRRRKTNPRRRRNTTRRSAYGAIALRTNQGMDTGIMPVDALAGAVDKVPLVGPILGPYVAPLLVGAGSGAGIYFLTGFLEPYLPEWLERFKYSTAGVAGAAATLYVPMGTATSKRVIAGALATAGAAIDAYRWWQVREDAVAMEAAGLLENGNAGLAGYGAWDYTGGPLNNPGCYGAGCYGAWDYTGGPLNNPAYGAEDEGTDEYNDAEELDEAAAGPDFDAVEGRALVAGPRVWWRTFGKPGKRMYHRRRDGQYSRHAGKPGHRWGWLIKMVGFQGARRIAAMQPQQRLQIMQRLKAQARATLKAHFDHANQNIVQSQPHVFEGSGPTGAHGYGALMYTGNSY
jgi:hypothetical protein